MDLDKNKKEELKLYLDSLVEKYKIPDFIKNDPIKFPHKYNDPKDQEIMGFIASTLAQGRRTKIVESIEKIEKIIENKPYEFVKNFDYEKDFSKFENFSHFAYRNILGSEIAGLIYLLRQVLDNFGSLKNLFLKGFDENKQKNVKSALIYFTETLFNFELPSEISDLKKKISPLVPNPAKGSACKRLNMYLRWMVRKDNVDLGLWSEVPTSMLIIPLDAHVSKLSRKLFLTQRKQDDWNTAEEITENLKIFDINDPVKYDFAIFGMGISGEKPLDFSI